MIPRNKNIICDIKEKELTAHTITEPEQWHEVLIEVILRDLDEAGNGLDPVTWPDHGLYYLVFRGNITSGRDRSGVLSDVWTALQELPAHSRLPLCRAFDKLVEDCVTELPNTEAFLLRLMLLGSGLEGMLRGDIAVKLAEDRKLSEDIRIAAARSLLERDYCNGVPLSFWESLPVTEYPNMAPLVMSAFEKHRHYAEILGVMKKLYDKPTMFVGGMGHSCEMAIEEILGRLGGCERLLQIFNELPQWARRFLLGSFEVDEELGSKHRTALMTSLS